MADKTGISWTNATWNPIRGCSVVSEGCSSCYAASIAARFSGEGQPYEGLAKMQGGKGIWTGKTMLIEKVLDQPLRWKTPRRIFVNSMSDLFHETIPDEYIDRVFEVMDQARQHTFQVLTKRPKRMREYCKSWCDDDRCMPENVWLGVSAETQAWADKRIPILLDTPAAIRFVSVEPQLELIDLSSWVVEMEEHQKAEWMLARYERSQSLSWVIVGGESGRNHRPFDPEWARFLRDQCAACGISFFFKQHGGATSKSGGDLLDGVQYHQFPE